MREAQRDPDGEQRGDEMRREGGDRRRTAFGR